MQVIEVPIDEFKINPVIFTKKLDDLITNKRTKLKKRVGKAYEWSKDKIGSLLKFADQYQKDKNNTRTNLVGYGYIQKLHGM